MDTAPRSVVENINNVVSLDEELTARRSLGERVGSAVGSFAGRLAFVECQLAVVAGWVVANAGLVPSVPAFDPFPYARRRPAVAGGRVAGGVHSVEASA